MSAVLRDLGADFAVVDERGRVTIVVEAKKVDADTTWAEEWFDLFKANRGGDSEFVLLATPRAIYVWRPSQVERTPAGVIDGREAFTAYLRGRDRDAAQLTGAAFEFLVGAWLNDVAQKFWSPSRPDEVSLFIETGLRAAFENGRVVRSLPA